MAEQDYNKSVHDKNDVVQDYREIVMIRAMVFQAFAATTDILSCHEVSSKTGFSVETVRARVNELVDSGQLYACGQRIIPEKDEMEWQFTSNPYVAETHYLLVLQDLFDTLASFPNETCDLIRAVRQYAIKRDSHIPDFLFSDLINLGRIWREIAKPLLDKEIMK